MVITLKGMNSGIAISGLAALLGSSSFHLYSIRKRRTIPE
jgi:hypothetical protein